MILFFSFIAAIFSLVSAFWALKKGFAERNQISKILAFSSGIMISVSFLHFLPEGYSQNSSMTSWSFLMAVLVLFSLENFTVMNTCSEFVEDCHMHSLGFFAFAAMTLHSFIDGFNISVGFSFGKAVGFNSLAAVMMHKFADGITLAAILRHAGFSDKKNIFYAALMSFATVVGSAMSYRLISSFSYYSPVLLGISAGSFIYISATEIIPHLHREKRFSSPFLFLGGYLFVFLIHFMAEHK
ncbi:MAG: ZIP family metal transporter [Elusimicrobiota bacterium]